VEAVRQLGSNALPFLSRWMLCEASTWKERLFRNLPSVLQDQAILVSLLNDKTDVRHQLARTGFKVLGPLATPALPLLSEALTNSSPVIRQIARDAIGDITREALTEESIRKQIIRRSQC